MEQSGKLPHRETDSGKRPQGRPWRLLIVIPACIFASEMLIMFLLDDSGLASIIWAEGLLNAVLLLIVLTPLLYVFAYRPIQRQITSRDRALKLLRESEKRFQDIAANADEWIWEVDAQGKYTYSSPMVEKLLGYTVEQTLHKHFYDFFADDEREALTQAAFQVFAEKRPFRNFINRNVHKNGSSVWLSTAGVPVLGSHGELLGYRGADSLKDNEASITDPLTGVLNRRGFQLLAEQQLKVAARSALAVSVLYMDIDDMKRINDEFGHAEGDRLIVDVAAIIRRSIREADIVARFGGDEFVVLLTMAEANDTQQAVIRHIEEQRDAFNRDSGKPYPVSFSIGSARFDPRQMQGLDDLIQSADHAMYRDKKRDLRRASDGKRIS